MIAPLFKGLLSLLPAINWKRTLQRNGLPIVAAGVLLYEVAIPLRDELLASSRVMRAALEDVTKAKLDDSISLTKLTLLYEEQQRRNRERPVAAESDDLTRSEAHLR